MSTVHRIDKAQEDSRGEHEPQSAPISAQLLTSSVNALQSHPSYVRHRIAVSAAKLSSLCALGDLAFLEPILITQGGVILDGYARCQLARLQGRLLLPCIKYQFTDEQALQFLLHKHRRSDGLNDFCRVILALDLERPLQEKARANQQVGGRQKGLANLSKAQAIDVRSEIAKVAGVSVGNVSKVKQLLGSAQPDVLQAIRNGEISIHRAWLWRREPFEKQREALQLYRSAKGVHQTIRTLISRHESNSIPSIRYLHALFGRLFTLTSDELNTIAFSVFRMPGRAVYITEELCNVLKLERS